MDKTIKELAEEIGISKQSLYKRIKREPLHTRLHMYVHKKGHTTYINIHGQNLIKSTIKENDCTQKPNMYTHEELHTRPQSDTVGMQSIIDLLSKQLEEKDNQISALNKRLAASQELHRNEQVILKIEQEKVLALEAPKESIFQKLKSKKQR